VTPPFVASLADDSRVVIYYCNMFIVQATGLALKSCKVKKVYEIWLRGIKELVLQQDCGSMGK
jgi:hypothetical protein